MHWNDVEEVDQIEFENEFGKGLADRIDACVDTGSLFILIELAKARLAEVNQINCAIDQI